MRENNSARCLIFRLLGLSFSIIPPLLATLSYFPLWQRRGSAEVISGLAVLLLLLCFTPLLKYIAHRIKSPSAHTVWLIVFLLFFALSRICEQMTVISFIGFIGNIVGAIFFKLSEEKNEKP